MKRVLLATLAIFVAFQITDFLIHGVMLMNLYEQTADLWRPMEEMKRPLMMFVSLIHAFSFCFVFGTFFKTKGIKNGLIYGLIFGISAGASMGLGTYSFQDIPMSLALGWFGGATAQSLLAGLLAGLIIKE